MKQIGFSLDSNGSLGCTFLEWSLHWLSNQKSYYNWRKNIEIPLVSDPIDKKNAHLHHKNHPRGFEETKLCIETITNQSSNILVSCYSGDYDISATSKLLNIPITSDNRNSLNEYALKDMQKRINYLYEKNFKVIHVYLPNKLNSYSDLPARQPSIRTLNNIETVSSFLEIQNYFIEQYFDKVKRKFANNEIWDYREKLAIILSSNILKNDIEKDNYEYKKNLQLTSSHKFIIVEDLWYNGHDVVVDLLDFIELKLDKERFEQWRLVYKKWQNIQVSSLKFLYYLDHIVDSIINNYNFNLSQFNLTVIHEAIIQSRLLRDHNLTLKNYQLSKFPDNTQDIHKLLEENFHTIL